MSKTTEFAALRFLIVDANAHTRRIVRSILVVQGCKEICEVENGAAALDTISSFAPNIVIADLSSPVLNAIELTKIIRSSPTLRRSTRIVVLSTEVRRGDLQEARDAGVDLVLIKPVSPKVLCDRLNYLVRQFPIINAEPAVSPKPVLMLAI